MTRQVTLTISEQTYKQAEYLAQLRRQAVADILADHLAETFPLEDEELLPQSDSDPLVEQERNAYLSLHAELWRNYPHQYVAIHQGQLIDHDRDKLALFQRIDEQYPHEFVLIRQVEPAAEKVYRFHSTRFVS